MLGVTLCLKWCPVLFVPELYGCWKCQFNKSSPVKPRNDCIQQTLLHVTHPKRRSLHAERVQVSPSLCLSLFLSPSHTHTDTNTHTHTHTHTYAQRSCWILALCGFYLHAWVRAATPQWHSQCLQTCTGCVHMCAHGRLTRLGVPMFVKNFVVCCRFVCFFPVPHACIVRSCGASVACLINVQSV